ncbi:MAG: hypothetical protein PWQ27_1791, partial [Kosmotoga sp.]|nr:hypothetical protein [Kosmotoga sp.]
MRKIENERKFLISEEKAKDLKSKAEKKCGIIQWYLDPGKTTRIRLEIWKEITGFRHIWTKTIKNKEKGSGIRSETEETLDPKDIKLEELKDKPFVMKIRYFLQEEHPEVILDEFMLEKHPQQNFKEKNSLLCEIELSQGDSEDKFEQAIKAFGVDSEHNEVTGKQKYENENIAAVPNQESNPWDYIKYLENRLKGKTVVVALQGRSLFNKIKNKNIDDNDKEAYEKLQTQLMHEFNPDLIPEELIYVSKNKEEKKLKKYFQKGSRFDYKELKGISAELDSISLIRDLGYDIEKVFMFVFPDDNGKFSKDNRPAIYDYLERLIENAFGLKTEPIKIIYSSSDKKLSSNTFKTIWDELDKIVEDAKEDKKEVIVDVAPGQKYPGIMAALFCIFNKIPFFYKFERSDEILKFPPIPATWDFSSIDEALSAFISLIDPPTSQNEKARSEKKDESISYSQYAVIPQIFRDIYSTSSSPDKLESILPLRKIFKEYKNVRKLPFGYGEEYFKLISRNNPDDPRVEYLREQIRNIWSMQWIGDQIPETVEHSQRHSKRLMEFTVNLINAIGEENFLKGVPENLISDFYFVLGIAMNVHDLGHTKLSFKNKKISLNLDGLPSVVRDLHNELTYQMLEEEDTYHLLEAEKNREIKNWENIVKAVKLVSRYHRGHMPIDTDPSSQEDRKDFLKTFNIETKPLVELCKEEEVFGNSEDWQTLTIIAARWLKFIDGVDVQADRTVDPAYRKLRIKRTAYELIKLTESFINENPEICKTNNLNKFLLEIKEKSSKIFEEENSDHNLRTKIAEIGKLIEKTYVYPELNRIIENQKEGLSKIPEWLKTLDRIAFKALQFPHFEKHNLVSFVYPRFYKKNSICGNFDKTLYLSLNINREEGPTTDKESKEYILKMLSSIKNDIITEFKKAGLDKGEFAIKKIKMEVEPVNEKVLITPLGTSPGVLYTLIKKLNPDKILVITSEKAAEKIPEICKEAGYDESKISIHKLDD